MDNINSMDIELLEQATALENDHKLKNKVKRRRWREIEIVKEKRRLNKELMTFDFYQY